MASNSELETRNPKLLEVRDLRTYFELDEGVVHAVDGVSFDVEQGQTVAIVGESGCGKSVAVRSILRLIDPPGRLVSGQILLRHDGAGGNRQVTDLAQLHPDGAAMRLIRGNQIALIFQEPIASFSPVHTVGNQIIEAIRVHRPVKRRQARQIAIEILSQTGVPQPHQRIDDYPHQLSGGLLQRAMIAMALSSDPRILIADEPTTALDVTTQAQILALLRKIQQQHDMAVIFITHDLGVVAHVADVVVVMYLGKVVERGPADQIFHDPKHPYTQALLRSIPSIRSRRQDTLESIAGSIPHPLARPSGCPFHPRCPQFMAGSCDRDEPALLPIAPGHDAACFLYQETQLHLPKRDVSNTKDTVD